MTRNSLRLRQTLIAGVSITVALAAAGLGLVMLFERHVGRRVDAELDAYLRQLAASITFAADGAIQLDQEPSDPRFAQPLSGLYWQIAEDTAGAKLRSRSLWDHVINLPADELASGSVHHHILKGPDGVTLVLSELRVAYTAGDSKRTVRIAAAIDRRDILNARHEFAEDVAVALAVLAVFQLLAAGVQIVIGLKPLEALRRSVMAVRSGRQPRMAAAGPDEVMPLVAEFNSLLDAQAAAIASAKARAADLAHGLKTPLTAVAMDAQRLHAKGETEIARDLEELAAAMQRHINRELFRARLQSAAGAIPPQIPLRGVIEGVIRTLTRGLRGEHLTWNTGVPPEIRASMRLDDLTELAGVLLDNAAKWAEREVYIRAWQAAEILHITIEDDGAGVSPEQLEKLGRRGVRLDEAADGTGLGLAIARDIMEAYGGQITFGSRPPHGFRVEVTLPAKTSAPAAIDPHSHSAGRPDQNHHLNAAASHTGTSGCLTAPMSPPDS
jgi:signal transduction histidine kinase